VEESESCSLVFTDLQYSFLTDSPTKVLQNSEISDELPDSSKTVKTMKIILWSQSLGHK
jgi:hypothetical protein